MREIAEVSPRWVQRFVLVIDRRRANGFSTSVWDLRKACGTMPGQPSLWSIREWVRVNELEVTDDDE